NGNNNLDKEMGGRGGRYMKKGKGKGRKGKRKMDNINYRMDVGGINDKKELCGGHFNNYEMKKRGRENNNNNKNKREMERYGDKEIPSYGGSCDMDIDNKVVIPNVGFKSKKGFGGGNYRLEDYYGRVDLKDADVENYLM